MVINKKITSEEVYELILKYVLQESGRDWKKEKRDKMGWNFGIDWIEDELAVTLAEMIDHLK